MYPKLCILVPHQMKASSTIIDSLSDMKSRLPNCGVDEYESIKDIETAWGYLEDAPSDIQVLAKANAFPIYDKYSEHEHQFTCEKPDLEEWLMECMAYDLHQCWWIDAHSIEAFNATAEWMSSRNLHQGILIEILINEAREHLFSE